MEIEERIVYPLIAERVGREEEQEAEIEHQLARDGIANVKAMVEEPGFRGGRRDAHGRDQAPRQGRGNRGLPEAESKLSRDELRALGDAVADAKRAKTVNA